MSDLERLLKKASKCQTMLEEARRQKQELTTNALDIERERTATLEFLRKTQQQMVDMINGYFTSIDEAYADATPEEMDLINDRLNQIRNDPQDPMFDLKVWFCSTLLDILLRFNLI